MEAQILTMHVGKGKIEGCARHLLFYNEIRLCPQKNGNLVKGFKQKNDKLHFYERSLSCCVKKNQRNKTDTRSKEMH